jgi:hypothetical protein
VAIEHDQIRRPDARRVARRQPPRQRQPGTGVEVVLIEQHDLAAREASGVLHADREGASHRVGDEVRRAGRIRLRPALRSDDQNRRLIVDQVGAHARAVGLHEPRLQRSGAAQRDALVDEHVLIEQETPGRELHRFAIPAAIDGVLDRLRRLAGAVAEARRLDGGAHRRPRRHGRPQARRPRGAQGFGHQRRLGRRVVVRRRGLGRGSRLHRPAATARRDRGSQGSHAQYHPPRASHLASTLAEA